MQSIKCSRLSGSLVFSALALWGVQTPVFADAACVNSADFTRTQSVVGNSYMVTAANPLAVEAGCEVLRDGGTAIDAAVAVQMALSVVEPEASGVAGGSLITYWDNQNKRVRFFEGLSRAPKAVTASLRTSTEEDKTECGVDSFTSRVNITGRAFGVPGTLRVLELAHNELGNKPWNTLFSVGINLAESGFPMPLYMNTVLGETQSGITRCMFPDLQARYCVDDTTPKATGTTILNPEIADVLKKVRDGGADAFYDPEGDIAPKIVARIKEGTCAPDATPPVIPSLMTVDDFAAYQAREREPICRDVLNHTICSSAPPAFGGVAIHYMLGLMERGGISSLKPDNLQRAAQAAHLFIESSRLAQIDRRQYVGDPDFSYIPVSGLLDKDYLDSRFALFSPNSSVHPTPIGNPPGGLSLAQAQAARSQGETETIQDMTSHISIVDSLGNALSMTTTNNSTFGSQMEALGITLNNVQSNFSSLTSAAPGIPVNGMESMKKARTSTAPTLVFSPSGALRLVVGAAGGGAIPDYIAQTILGVLSFNMDPQTAINQPHVSGQSFTSAGGELKLRSQLEADTLAAELENDLEALGHPAIQVRALRSGLTAIEVKPNGQLLGAADPRRDGVAMGL